jgi:hypothetical protein
MKKSLWSRFCSWFFQEGYTPKGYITRYVNGEPVKFNVSDIKIVPPKSRSAAVMLKTESAAPAVASQGR